MRYLLIVAALALVAAGCGGGTSSRVAHLGAATTTARTPQASAAAFAACMRSHGVPSWPDPGADGAFDKSRLVALGIPKARMIRLQAPCLHLLPAFDQPNPKEQRFTTADALSFARCMRHHGVSNFPDPSAHSGLSIAMVQAQGIDVHSSAFLRVADTCVPASHGGLTPARVREAIQNAGH